MWQNHQFQAQKTFRANNNAETLYLILTASVVSRT